jgi:hypothetical protein
MNFCTASDTSVNRCFVGSLNFELIARISARSRSAVAMLADDTLIDGLVGSVSSSVATADVRYKIASATAVRMNI